MRRPANGFFVKAELQRRIAAERELNDEAATVLVEGRDETALWLSVSEIVAAGGWITGNANPDTPPHTALVDYFSNADDPVDALAR